MIKITALILLSFSEVCFANSRVGTLSVIPQGVYEVENSKVGTLSTPPQTLESLLAGNKKTVLTYLVSQTAGLVKFKTATSENGTWKVQTWEAPDTEIMNSPSFSEALMNSTLKSDWQNLN